MSSEVGSGHISIFPVMTGFKSIVTKGTKDAGAAGAKSFEGGFKGAGTKAGRSLGRDLKSAMSSAAGDLAAAELGKLKGQVASASAALSKARVKQMDEAGKVRVAETRLQEAVSKYGEGSSQAVAAEERLATARRRQQVVMDSVTAATERLQVAQEAARKATEGMSAASAGASGGLRRMTSNLRDGWKNADAARSAFTGVSGSVGGLLRAVSDVSGLSSLGRLAKLTAGQISASFVSLATMVGGRLVAAWTSSSRWLSRVGSSVASALAPLGRFAASAGRAIASPFVRLGTQVSSWMRPVSTQVSGLFSKVAASAGPAASRLVSTFGSGLAGIGSTAARGLQSVVSAAARVGSAAGQALGAALKSTATAGVTIAAAGIGIALTAGFSRLKALDTARAKLVGLGKDGKTVATVMRNANASVRGTAFGLGEAATVAAGAMAAQIKPGKNLQAHLKNIANTAAAAGTSMEDMGSIFNKAATQANGVQNDVIGQLADKGIPIYDELGKILGVTAGEVFKLASDGKIDFKTFSTAAKAAAGTVAEEMGKTVPGSLKNLRASLGRIGANIFGGISQDTGELFGIYAKLAPLFQSVTKALGPLEAKAANLGEKLTALVGPWMDKLTTFFTRLGDGSVKLSSLFGNLTPLLAPLGAGFLALGAGGLGGLLSKIPLLSGLLPGLTRGLGLLGGPLGIAAAAFGAFVLSGGDVGALVSSITGIVDQIVAALPSMVEQVAEFIPQLVSGILVQVPTLLSAAVAIVNALVEGLVTSIPVIAIGAVDLVQGLITGIVAALPLLIRGAILLVTALIKGIVTAIPLLVTAALQLVDGLLTAIIGALPMIIEGGIQLLMALVLGIVEALPQLLTAAVDLVMGLLGAIIDNLPMLIDAGIQLLLSLVTGLIEALPQLITAAISLVLQLVVGLLDMLPRLIEAGITLVVSLITGLIKAIPQIIEMLPQIIEAIWNGLMGVDWLDLGAQIIQGIIDGFFSMVGGVGDAIGEVLGGILDFFPHSPAKRGPLSASGWRQLKSSGAATMGQFIDGAQAEAPAFGDALSEVARSASAKNMAALSSVSGEMSLAVSASRAGSGAPEGASGSSGRESTVNVYPSEGMSEETIGRVAADALNWELRRA